jgi:bacillopeptidase F (M6 metalloprotease family)
LIPPRTAYITTGWTRASFDLSAWSGKLVTVVFNVFQSSADKPTLAWVDGVSLTDPEYKVVLPLIRRAYVAQ